MDESVNNLLVELFVEELPPKALKTLGEAFAGGLLAGLQAQGLAGAPAVATPFASPRGIRGFMRILRSMARAAPWSIETPVISLVT